MYLVPPGQPRGRLQPASYPVALQVQPVCGTGACAGTLARTPHDGAHDGKQPQKHMQALQRSFGGRQHTAAPAAAVWRVRCLDGQLLLAFHVQASLGEGWVESGVHRSTQQVSLLSTIGTACTAKQPCSTITRLLRAVEGLQGNIANDDDMKLLPCEMVPSAHLELQGLTTCPCSFNDVHSCADEFFASLLDCRLKRLHDANAEETSSL